MRRKIVRKLLRRLHHLRRNTVSFDRIEFDQVSDTLLESIKSDTKISLYSVGGFRNQSVLWHLCTTKCRFEIIAGVHNAFLEGRAPKPVPHPGRVVYAACKAHCDVETIRFLAERYPEGNTRLDLQNRALTIALASDHPEIVELFRILYRRDTMVPPDLMCIPSKNGYPGEILDTVIGCHQSVGCECDTLDGMSARNFIAIQATSRRGETSGSIRVLLHVDYLNPFLMTLIRRQAPLVALTTDLFEEIPVHAIGMLETLRMVRLNEGTISNDTLADLIAALSVQDNLKELEIKTTYLQFASPLPFRGMTNLQHLDLHGNRLGPNFAQPLAELLLATAALVSLKIGGNSIGREGTELIIDALRHNRSVEKLAIDDDSVDSLLHLLKHHNSTLNDVSVSTVDGLRVSLPQVKFWLDVNRCGRRMLSLEDATKEDVVLVIGEVLGMSSFANKDSRKVGVCYELLKTNPGLWCT